jgi:D-beta-D-heptose 7-phosphate kinase/D-beta-D-heptose 1-phosphate adenosyltransferase
MSHKEDFKLYGQYSDMMIKIPVVLIGQSFLDGRPVRHRPVESGAQGRSPAKQARRTGEAGLSSKKNPGELIGKMIQKMGIHQDSEKLKRCVDRFSDAKVVVVGDIIMDEYIWGDVSRISPEAPVPVVDIKEETTMLGGAANVLNNIASSESHRPTSIKTRVVAHNQQVVRFDRESRKKLGSKSIEKILDFIKKMQGNYDAILVADYGKGVISAELMEGLRGLVLKSSAILAVDPKIGNFECYQKVDVITPNHHEAGAFCRIEIIDQESLVRAGNQMLSELNCRSVLITQGKDGMSLFEESGEINHIPTVARKVYDVTGAGDTVISTSNPLHSSPILRRVLWWVSWERQL